MVLPKFCGVAIYYRLVSCLHSSVYMDDLFSGLEDSYFDESTNSSKLVTQTATYNAKFCNRKVCLQLIDELILNK